MDAAAVAGAVREDRLWELLMRLGEIGATSRGGVDRQALTSGEIAAKAFVADWAARRGFTCAKDPAANLFIRMEGADRHAAPLLIGSHLDTQPTGGRFDGAYGVAAGLEILDAFADLGIVPDRPVEVVSWTNEEGCRFQPGATGSSAFAGTRSLDAMVAGTTVDGVPVAAAIARAVSESPGLLWPLGQPRPLAFLEAHIEQGPILETEGLAIGVVEGVQGIRRLVCEFEGRTAHAGTTPHPLRRDALVAASRFVTAVQAMHRADEDLRLTVGRIECTPNAPNTVPDRVRLIIDLRHPRAEALREATRRIEAEAAAADPACAARTSLASEVDPVAFDPDLVARVAAVAEGLDLPARRMVSGAGHDAMHLARICPTAMVFVPCRDGVSHHEDEYAEPGHLAAGARILAVVAAELVGALRQKFIARQ